jgi:hypothetical protein
MMKAKFKRGDPEGFLVDNSNLEEVFASAPP